MKGSSKIFTLIFLGLGIVGHSHAQAPDTLQVIPDTKHPYVAERLPGHIQSLPLHCTLDSSRGNGGLLLGDSTSSLAREYALALKAAEVDPGILIFPCPEVEAEILTIEPREKVDPEMIFPDSVRQ